MSLFKQPLLALLLGSVLLPGWSAEISFVNQFRNLAYTQTGDNTAVADGAFFSASAVLSSQANGVYDSGTLTVGDPNTGASYPLSSTDGGKSFGLQTPLLASQAAMDAQFPLSTLYTFALSGNSSSASADMQVGENAYSAAVPLLTGNSFSALQGMDSTQPLSLTFTPMNSVPGASSEFIFFSIYDYTTGTSLHPLSFAPPTTAGLTLAANLLTPGDQYAFELIHSVRVTVPGSGADFAPEVGFDQRTTGLFSTALPVPEPTTAALWALGLAVLIGGSRQHFGQARSSRC